mmetsp:Transcript_87290/g.227710  ORF Transcript_87290/g.227710 Transcript_87290/m.227710 type:complete len:212 (+) Transcript_87290:292-927(+)
MHSRVPLPYGMANLVPRFSALPPGQRLRSEYVDCLDLFSQRLVRALAATQERKGRHLVAPLGQVQLAGVQPSAHVCQIPGPLWDGLDAQRPAQLVAEVEAVPPHQVVTIARPLALHALDDSPKDAVAQPSPPLACRLPENEALADSGHATKYPAAGLRLWRVTEPPLPREQLHPAVEEPGPERPQKLVDARGGLAQVVNVESHRGAGINDL